MKINQAQTRAFRAILRKNPDAREALSAWAEAKGIQIPMPVASRSRAGSIPGGGNLGDALAETGLPYVSRPDDIVELHHKGVTGKGVTVAVVDSGIAPHPDLKDRIVAFRDFTGNRVVKRRPTDPTGHGTHVAGLIAGENESVPGIAPEANLVGCRINSEHDAIKAIDWIIENKDRYSIDVLNLSLGVEAPANPADDQFRKAAERAVKAGLIVVAAAGNECSGRVCNSTISSPGNSPEVITVGALDDRGTVTHADDRVYGTSSRGKEEGGKPDLVAEGVNVLGPLAPQSNYAKQMAHTAKYVALVGSSQAAPMVSGAIALMLQVNPKLDQDEVKSILKGTADKLKGEPRSAQGSGRLDVGGAVEAARRRLR